MNKKTLTISAVIILLVVIVACAFSSSLLNVWSPQGRTEPVFNYNFAGISLHSLLSEEAQFVNDTDVNWIRIDIFEDVNSSIVNAKSYGFKVLGILDSWTMNYDLNFTITEWTNNVTYYVSRYADFVDAWEIWNEPANANVTLALCNLKLVDENGSIIQQNMSQIVDFYYSMTQTAYTIIRQYDPEAEIVLFGGLNLWSGGDPHLDVDKEFAKQLAAKGIQNYGDAISVHAYPWGKYNNISTWENYSESLSYYKMLFPNLEFWVTETGCPENQEGETIQAQYLSDAYDFFQGKVTHMFWYSLEDNSWEPDNFGLIGQNGTQRLAYFELQKINCKEKS